MVQQISCRVCKENEGSLETNVTCKRCGVNTIPVCVPCEADSPDINVICIACI